ncbi:MAG: hypothetical protein ACI358_04215 [Candidatus Limimorpha sp.]
MHILSKSTYIKGEQCEKALYLYKKRPFLRDKLSLEKRAKFKRGTDVGILARQRFPNGLNMAPASPSQFGNKTAETLANLSNPDVNVMYEAVFQYDDTLIMLDILVRDGDKWRAIEVKSSLSISTTYMKDAALQYYVLKGCGVPISDIQLMYINANYVRNGDLDLSELFVFKSVKSFAEEQVEIIGNKIKHFKELLNEDHSPNVSIGEKCETPYHCEFYSHCWKNIPENSVVNTKGLSSNKIDAMLQHTFHVDYRQLYELLPVRNSSTAFLSLLFYIPAIPILDGDRPYNEFILGFSILKNNGTDDSYFYWDCIDNIPARSECFHIMAEQLKGISNVIYFAPQNLNAHIQKSSIEDAKELNYKTINLMEALTNSDFFHKNTRSEFSLKNVYESIFPDKTLFEHSRILLNATSGNEIDRQLVESDLMLENNALRDIIRYFRP